MLETLASAWKVVELRKKIIFTMLMFLVFRIGAHIPVPGINDAAIEGMLNSQIFGFMDIISGGSFKKFTIFAMGIIPYINASIIVNLLTIVIPYFERLAKEGQEGRKKMTQIIRYGTVVLGFAQALVMSIYLRGALINPSVISILIITITLTAGTAFLMWLGESITEKGIGNGISLIILAGICATLPRTLVQMFQYVKEDIVNVFVPLGFLVVFLLVIAFIVTIQEGQRRIPVQYAKRVVGRKMYGGQSTHIPMKINQAGVIPIIFAMAILMFPQTIASAFADTNGFARFLVNVFDYQHPVYMITYALMILFFTYFYTAVTFNVNDVAENLKKYGGFIPGLRPGRPTVEYLDRVLSRVTFGGAVFLALIALFPSIAMGVTGMNLYFGGTSLLIAVGVSLDTMKQIESHLLMRHYQGFMK